MGRELVIRAMVGCETSGRMREALRRQGVEAYSCDLLPSVDNSPWHIQGDIRRVMALYPPHFFDLFIVHPDCTYLCSSGLHWNTRGRMVNGVPRAVMTERALDFVREMLAMPVDHIALENPQGCIGTHIRKSDDKFQPYEFGDDASKMTHLWLKNLPKLVKDPAKRFPGRWVEHNGKMVERWSNQTDSGQNKLGPSDDRWSERSATYPGFAEAAAQQYVAYIRGLK